MDDNRDAIGRRDGQQPQDDPPAWTHPAFADAVRAADLTRTQYLQLAARRQAQQSPQKGYQQVQQQSRPPSHPPSQQQSPQQGHQNDQQQGHHHSHPQSRQQSQQNVQQQGHPQSHPNSRQQIQQQVPPQGYQQAQQQGRPPSHQQGPQQEEEWRQQQQHYYHMKKLQELQTQQYPPRASPSPGPNSSNSVEGSNGTFNRGQPGQSQSTTTVAQPPRPSTESPNTDLRGQYVRPSDLGPSMSHYGVNPLRRTSNPFAMQSQQPPNQTVTGEDNEQSPARSNSQIVHTRPPSNPRSSTPSHPDRERNPASSNPAPSAAPPPRPDSTTERRQQTSQAKVMETDISAQFQRVVDKYSNPLRANGKLPVATTINSMDSPKGDAYNSASRSTIHLQPANQGQANTQKPSSTPKKPSSQKPVHQAPVLASHLATKATTSSIPPPLPAAHTRGSSTTANPRDSSTQSSSTDLNQPGPSSSNLPVTKPARSPQPRYASTPASFMEPSRQSSGSNHPNQSKPMGLTTSDTPARNSSAQPTPVQEAKSQGQSSFSKAPQAPLQRSISAPQQTHGAMQPPSRPTKTPATVVNQSAVPASHRNLPTNTQATNDRELSRGPQSTVEASRSTSSTTSSNAPPKQIPQAISNALPSIKRKWNQYAAPQELPAQNGTPQRDRPPAGQQSSESMPPPNKIQRLEDGSKQGQNPKTLQRNHPSKKIHVTPSQKTEFTPRSRLKHRHDLVQPFDSNEADSKITYDPATIARDVLIAAAKHPTEGRLNHHLAILTKNLPNIDGSKDLATLRWDIIDPVVPHNEPASHRPPARGPPISAPPINAPINVPMNAPINAPSSLVPNDPRAVAYRPVQHYPQPPPFGAFSRPSYHSPYHPSHHPQYYQPYPIPPIPARIPPQPHSLPPPPPPSSAPLSTPQALTPSHSASAPKPIPTSKPKPPKQPKGSKAKKPEGASVVKATPPPSPQVIIDLSPGPKKSLESPRAQKRSSLQVVIKSPQKMNPQKRRGRPRKDEMDVSADGPATSDSTSQPEYPVFGCLWANCQAELHNLSGLQSHVLKEHVPHNIECGWKDCKIQTPMAAAAMWEHVRDSHIKTLVWSHGDGPSVSAFAGDSNEPPALRMSTFAGFGRNVRHGTMVLPAEPVVVNAYNRVHNVVGSWAKAVSLKEAGCRWKEDTGPDADINDCQLSHPDRLSHSRVADFAMTPDYA